MGPRTRKGKNARKNTSRTAPESLRKEKKKKKCHQIAQGEKEGRLFHPGEKPLKKHAERKNKGVQVQKDFGGKENGPPWRGVGGNQFGPANRKKKAHETRTRRTKHA